MTSHRTPKVTRRRRLCQVRLSDEAESWKTVNGDGDSDVVEEPVSGCRCGCCAREPCGQLLASPVPDPGKTRVSGSVSGSVPSDPGRFPIEEQLISDC